MYARALENVNMDVVTNVRLYDFPNMMGQITSFLHAQKKQEEVLKNGTYVNEIIARCFQRLESLLQSKYFENLVKTIRGQHYLSYIHDITSIDRIFIKKMTDLSNNHQISVENIKSALPYLSSDYVIEDRIKKINYKGKKEQFIYCDVDALMIHALIELLYHCRYNKNFMQYLVIGSGDKDYSDACRMAKEDGILVISVSIMGEGMSKRMLESSDIAFILFPRLCILKPYLYCLEELSK